MRKQVHRKRHIKSVATEGVATNSEPGAKVVTDLADIMDSVCTISRETAQATETIPSQLEQTKPTASEKSNDELKDLDAYLCKEIEKYTKRQERLRTGCASEDELKSQNDFGRNMLKVFETTSIGNILANEDAECHKKLYFKHLSSELEKSGKLSSQMCRGIQLLATYQSDVLVWDASFLHLLDDPKSFENVVFDSEAHTLYALTIFSEI